MKTTKLRISKNKLWWWKLMGLQPKVHHIFVSSLKRAKRFASLPNSLPLLVPFLMIKKERFVVGRYLFLVWNSIPGSCFCLTCLLPSPLSIMQCKLQPTPFFLFVAFFKTKLLLMKKISRMPLIERAASWVSWPIQLQLPPSLLFSSLQKTFDWRRRNVTIVTWYAFYWLDKRHMMTEAMYLHIIGWSITRLPLADVYQGGIVMEILSII